MKKIIHTLACCALLVACDLREEPYGFYSRNNFYKSEADAESGLMYAYNALTFLEYSRGIFYIGDIPTETMSPKSDEAGDVYQLENWIAGRETEQLKYYFKFCYIAINRANAVIDRLEDNPHVGETARRRILGEARFLRAWNYFNLVRTFGLVPVQTRTVAELSQTTPPMARDLDQLYDLVFADLTVADDLLQIDKRFGRADKAAAQSLMAKAYLTVASAKEHGVYRYREMRRDPQTMYDSAAYWAGKVVRDYAANYGFDDDLRAIYDVAKPDGPEHIFIMANDRSGTQEGNYSKLPLMFLPSNNSVPFYIRYGDGSLQRANGNGWGVFLCNDELRRKCLLHDRSPSHGTHPSNDLRPDGTTDRTQPSTGLLFEQVCRSRLYRRAHERPTVPHSLFGYRARLCRGRRAGGWIALRKSDPQSCRHSVAAGRHVRR